MNDIIIDILNTVSPSGYEIDMYQKVKHYLPNNWEVTIDNTGNIYCRTNAEQKSTLMIEAHYDEIGLMINHITSAGYLFVRPIGSIDPTLLHGCEMTVLSQFGEIMAVAGHNPAAITGKQGEISDFKEIWFDVCGKKDECRIGDYVVYPHRARIVSDKIIGAGIDNKASIAAMIICILSLDMIIPDDVSLCFCFSSKEEIHHKGIRNCIETIKPDIVISLDTTFAADVPGVSYTTIGDIGLGRGPALLYDPCCNRTLTQQILDIAIGSNLSIQPYCNISPSMGLNVTKIDNVKTAAILLPCRNMHSSVEICSLNDIYALVNLLQEIIIKSSSLILCK